MKHLFCFTFLFLSLSSIITAQEEEQSVTSYNASLIGEWVIDLRPTPHAEGYFQPFIVESIEGNTINGTFYGSNLENALLNDNWEKLYFAFTTNDGTNEYYHSGYLLDGKLFGITYCPDRKFTAPWTGSKK
ncbi:hypothetical protein [Robiginitalea aurantiaca]|uniref:Lipocalin-like domain-containing protein n=1 Tax=Robiginitalea aurantiaca TaxID=3056915 RepID=A0ABT7WF03_9FLAO|nr:hypothetical protein [Robiginitalea aurantiaca]MDM9631497.1 hypothetical protein [Robiginitalea aurantiaca]